MRFTEKHLAYVLAVERAGSFTEAARQLFENALRVYRLSEERGVFASQITL